MKTTRRQDGIRTTPALKTTVQVAAERAELLAWHDVNGAFFGMSFERAHRESVRLGGVDCLPTRGQHEAHEARVHAVNQLG